MALKIDPTKIHLGDTQHKYYAEYLPAYNEQEEKPEDCVLPPLTSLTLTPVSFTNVEEVCVFTFPDVTPVPPVYNPPIVPGGCVDFIATSAFVIKSPLSGALTLDSEGPPACGITIGGEIAMPTGFCEEITTNVQIDGLGKAEPVVSLSFTNSGAPDCALDLVGSITIDACKQFSGSVNITSSGTNPPALDLSLLPTNDNCGFELVGNIDLDACKEVSSAISITTSGTNPPDVDLSISPADDGCGFELTGNIALDACKEITSSVSITTSGTNPPEVDLSVTPADDGCGFELTGNIALDACKEITSSVSITTSGTNPPEVDLSINPADDGCGFELVGNIALDACKEITSSVNITTSGTNPPDVALSVLPADDGCGFELVGNISLDACKEITSSVNITTSGTNPPEVDLSVLPAPDGCGFDLIGNISLDACKEITSSVNITTSGTNPPQVDLSILPTDDGCGFELTGNIDLDACKEIKSSVNITTSGTNPPEVDLSVMPAPDGCGFDLIGNISLDACQEFLFSVDSSANSANIAFTQGIRQIGLLSLSSALSIASTNDGCGAQFSLELSPGNTSINIPACEVAGSVISGLYLEADAEGKLKLAGDLDVNIAAQVSGMYLGKNAGGGLELQGELEVNSGAVVAGLSVGKGAGGAVQLQGQLQTSCSGDPSMLELDTLMVRNILPPPPPCCQPSCYTQIDMCESTMYMKDIYTDQLLPHCDGDSDNSLSFVTGQLKIASVQARGSVKVSDNGLCSTEMTTETVHVVCSDGTTTINGGSITITSSTSGGNGLLNLSAAPLNGKTASWNTITLCDDEGKKMTAMVLMTTPEYVPEN